MENFAQKVNHVSLFSILNDFKLILKGLFYHKKALNKKCEFEFCTVKFGHFKQVKETLNKESNIVVVYNTLAFT